MKRFLGIALALALLAAPAFAGKKSPTVTIPQTVQIGSTTIPAGDYKVTWTGSGPSVQVTLQQKEKTVATFSARAIAGKNTAGVSTDKQGGVVVLQAIQLNDVSLVLENSLTPDSNK